MPLRILKTGLYYTILMILKNKTILKNIKQTGLILLTILFFLLSACSSPNNTRSIYLWKADLKLSEKDTTFFNNADITKLYIRFFDITKNAEKRIIPKGSLKYKGVNLKNYKIIPVIFIENSSLKNTDNKAVKELSENIIEKVKRFYDKKFPENIFTELQLDCDWTASTKESFFKLIDEIKSENKSLTVSSTIRLHQLKYPDKTGIPPADKGILMYYNMGSFKNPHEKNSILNNETGKNYLKNINNYPLELSLALPVFSWSVWFKQKEAKALIYGINSNNISNIKFLNFNKDNIYTVNKDTVFEQKYFRFGDVLKLESCEPKELKIAKKLCQPITNGEIIIFSYAPENSKIIKQNLLEEVYK